MLSEEKNKILSELERSKEEEEKSEIAMQSLASIAPRSKQVERNVVEPRWSGL